MSNFTQHQRRADAPHNLHVHDAENANEHFCVSRGPIEAISTYDHSKSNNFYSWVLTSRIWSVTIFLFFTAGKGVYNLDVSIITGVSINEAVGLQECQRHFCVCDLDSASAWQK